MMTPEQIKGKIRNLAKERGLSSQEVLQMYLFERVIERVSKTKYKDHIVLKGGFLIASMIGVDARTTMDMDTTIKGLPVEEGNIVRIIQEILSVDAGDGIKFRLEKITPIRADDEYNDYRVHFAALFGKINNPMKIDITTGDEITPAAIDYNYKTIFEDRVLSVKAYNLETILAEKYETIMRRNVGTTRARDFYDLIELFRLYRNEINLAVLKDAVHRTSLKRGSLQEIADWKAICDELEADPVVANLWNTYSNEYSYASAISYESIIGGLVEFSEFLNS